MILVSLVNAWHDWRYRNGPPRNWRASNPRTLTRWNDAGERAAFEVDRQRRAQADIIRSYERRIVGGCTNPHCDGRCGR